MHGGLVSLPRLVELVAPNPARILGVDGGTLQPGSAANITVLAPEVPAEIRAADFKSKARKHPF